MGRVTKEEQAALYAKACKTTCANIPQPLAHRYALDLNDTLERITKMQPVYDAAMRYRKILEKLYETPTDAVADAEFELSQALRDACKEVDNG